jgi:hypothetical protein
MLNAIQVSYNRNFSPEILNIFLLEGSNDLITTTLMSTKKKNICTII